MSKWFYHRAFVVVIGVALLTGMLLSGCGGSEEPVTIPPPAKVEKIGPKEYASPPPMMIDASKKYTATIHTNLGDITAELFPKDAPMTVNNFVFLAREGFYDGSPFHRVIKGFMIQTGMPAGTDASGPGYTFDDEPITKDYEEGTLAMANRGPNTNGSQFFICDADLKGRLAKNYTIFGQVTKGIDVVHEIASAPVEAQPGGTELSKPTIDIHVDSIEIRERD